MLYFNIANRSTPIPKAYPEYFLLSILQRSKTLLSTIPQPITSSHPVYLQRLHPFPLQLHDTSISAEGSVKGKKEGRKRIRVCSPNISLAKKSSVCFKSANDTFSSI